MLLLNFGHPITEEQVSQIKEMGFDIDEVINVNSQVDLSVDLAEQAVKMVDSTGVSMSRFSQGRIIVNLPSLNFSAAAVLAELHGRMGFFPPVLQLNRNSSGGYDVVNIIILQSMRNNARMRR